MTLKNDPNFELKLTFYLRKDMRNLVNFNETSGKYDNLHFDGSWKMTDGFKKDVKNLASFHKSSWE